jgi:hypothetical protein
MGKPEENIPLGRPKHMWLDNIKMDGWVVWTDVAEGMEQWRAHMSAAMNLRVPQNAG